MIAITRMRKTLSVLGACSVLFVCATFSSAAWAQAGYVHEVSGLASIQPASDKARPAKAGDTFEADTTFRTGVDGKVIVKFADGQVITLGESSALRVGTYRYAANDARQSASSLDLMKGEMRYVAGIIGTANNEGVRILAGESMVSIQKPGGADFIVSVHPDPKEIGFTVVAFGEIAVRTPYGPVHRVANDEYAPWRPGRTPPEPLPFAAAPAVVQAAAGELWATVLPPGAPVTVASAARTIGAIAAVTQAEVAAKTDPRLAGYVDAVANTVTMQRGSGGSAAANVGATFEAGTSFNTGADGRAVLKFTDGQIVVLGPGSTLTIDQYQFDPNNTKASKSVVDLVNGGMRYITGNIQTENHEGINITAGASIVDILTTGPADFTVVVNSKDPDKQQEIGVARVSLGEIAVFTPYGPISKIETDRSNLWGPKKSPTDPIPVASALAVVQAAVALQQAELPDNSPVAIASAALAAAAQAEANKAQALANANPENAQLRAAAQAAVDLASATTQAATAAAEASAANVISAMLGTLPPTAAGAAVAQIPASPVPGPVALVVPTATPGAGGGCTGSRC